jgi:hypothetical protein
MEVEVDNTPIKYEEGTVMTSPFSSEGKMVLKERLESYSTKDKWALVRWRVRFFGRYGKETNIDYYRAITEVGNPNTNISIPVPGVDFVTEEEEEEAIAGPPLIKNNKIDKNIINSIIKKRGRPKKKSK